MSVFSDATISVAVLNIINTIANVYWGMKLRSVQVGSYMVQNLREEKKELEESNATLHEKLEKTRRELEVYRSMYKRHKSQVDQCDRIHKQPEQTTHLQSL